jgi:hypothetical protein
MLKNTAVGSRTADSRGASRALEALLTTVGTSQDSCPGRFDEAAYAFASALIAHGASFEGKSEQDRATLNGLLDRTLQHRHR